MSSKNDTDLKKFIDDVAQNSHLRVEKDLGDGYFKLRSSEAQKRQAKQDIRCSEDIVIELLRNSRDAKAKNIFLATNVTENFRNILVVDDGVGIPKAHHEDVFKPYVTSKLDTMIQDMWGVHGRGMALYSTSVNAEQSYIVNSDNKLGTCIFIQTDLSKLGEKRDQSTFPSFSINENKELVIRGPKNILRTICEFAVENKDLVNIYTGTPVEIASTLYYFSSNKNNIDSIFNDPDSSTKLVDLLSYSSDVHDFKNYAKQLGISLSKRTARRIMDKDIKPKESILERISKTNITNNNVKNSVKGNIDIYDISSIHKNNRKKNNIKLSDEDKLLLKNSVINQFNNIADKYYLSKTIEPKLTIKNNKLTISFEVDEM